MPGIETPTGISRPLDRSARCIRSSAVSPLVPVLQPAVPSSMVSFGRKHRERRSAPEENPEVRQYRFLLREASPDAVVLAHIEALSKLSEAHRVAILSAVQRGLVAGQRLQAGDTDQIAHLLVLGERRSPNAFLSACAPETLLALSQAVIHSEASIGLFGRYAAWDGTDPEMPEDTSGAGFDPKVGQRDPGDDLRITGGGYGP